MENMKKKKVKATKHFVDFFNGEDRIGLDSFRNGLRYMVKECGSLERFGGLIGGGFPPPRRSAECYQRPARSLAEVARRFRPAKITYLEPSAKMRLAAAWFSPDRLVWAQTIHGAPVSMKNSRIPRPAKRPTADPLSDGSARGPLNSMSATLSAAPPPPHHPFRCYLMP